MKQNEIVTQKVILFGIPMDDDTLDLLGDVGIKFALFAICYHLFNRRYWWSLFFIAVGIIILVSAALDFGFFFFSMFRGVS